MAKTNPFDFLNAITHTKNASVFQDPKDYNAFLVNRGLSQFPDTVLFANEMNTRHHLDNDLQFSFHINIIRKKKRFSKWAKKGDQSEYLEVVQEYYGYSEEKARDALKLLSGDQLNELKRRISKGGKQK